MDQYIGKMLDNRYELLEVVGTGGMAVVYKAKCHRLNRFVAVKILKPEAAADPELRRRFRDESQAVAMLSHPNIVAVYDVSKTANLEYIVMELIDGITLKQYMRQKGGPLPWKEALHFITQVMRALRHAHSRGIIHRDIKPQNIMVLRDGSCKVADFGIAHLSNSQNTTTQEALGSVHYIAPEQAKGARVDARSDIYSAGVVLYEMLAGRLPYEGDSPVAVAIQHINSAPPLPSSFNRSIPLGLEQITMKAMALKPGDRYESARAMLLDLDAFRKDPKIVFPYSIGQEPITQIPMVSDEDETQIITAGAAAAYGTPPRTRPQRKGESRAYTEADEERRSQRDRRPTNGDSGRNKKKKKSSKGPVIAVTAVIVVFLILVCVFVARTLSGMGGNSATEVTIPSLVGMQYDDAVTKYGDTFNIVIGSYQEDNSQTEGAILNQDPEANKIVKQTKPTVTVTVCRHTDSINMPDITNKSESDALAALTAAGISSANIIKGTSVYSSDIDEGKVVSTSPAAGTPITSSTQVTYYLSKGADPSETTSASTEQVTVPQFSGTRTQIQAQLKELGLNGSFEEVEDDSTAGTVLSQSISAGTKVDKGTTITFTVSSGPKESESPSPSASESPSASPSESPSASPAESPSTSQAPAVTVDKSYTFSLPSDQTSVEVQVYVGSTVAYASSGVDTSQGSMTVTVSGSGTQTVSVYVNGSLYSSESVTFN